MKKIFNYLKNFIIKHHKCEKYYELRSELRHNGQLVEIEYECLICNKIKVEKLWHYVPFKGWKLGWEE